jgi:cytoskeletal protein RodZ
MWGKKRQRYMFRKHSRRGRVLWLVVGTLLIVGSVWFIPWQALSPVRIVDTLKSEAPKNESKQAIAEDQPEQSDTQDEPEQEDISDQPRKEAALEGTPPKEGDAPNNLLSPSSPSAAAQAAQLSPSPQAPSTPEVREVPQPSIYQNDYWYPEPGYWYSEPEYWDYGSDYYYWDY